MIHSGRTVQRLMPSIATGSILMPSAPLQTYIVSWTTTVEAVDRLRAARIALQRLLTSDEVECKAAPMDGSGQRTVVVPRKAELYQVVPPGNPVRAYTVCWTSTQVAGSCAQAASFAVNHVLWGERLEFTVADRFLCDPRIVTITKRQHTSAPN